MFERRARSGPAASRRSAPQFTTEDADDRTSSTGGVGPSYSVRVCGRCRVPAQRDTKGIYRCPSCGRRRGWA